MAVRHLGARWVAFRVWHAMMLGSGVLRLRAHSRPWSPSVLLGRLLPVELRSLDRYVAYRTETPPRFFFGHGDREAYAAYLRGWTNDTEDPVERSRALMRGYLRLFSGDTVRLGFPPEWHLNPATGRRLPVDLHWSRIGDFGHGDIKGVWEASRFAFTFDLVRAYWRTGDEAFPEVFWTLVEDWRKHNPPQRGPNWKCGQEASLRMLALCFGLYGFLGSPATTGTRVLDLAETVAVSATRIEVTLRYARSQLNNHMISEAVGLWTVALLFPELGNARRRMRAARHALDWAAAHLIYDDGSFAQHSSNYHRLVLQLYTWAIQLGRLHGQALGKETERRVEQAVHFAHQIQDQISGSVPHCGANDGALLLPLSNTEFWDFRPVTQAGHYLCSGRRIEADGPWDEALLWLFGMDAVEAPRDDIPRGNLDAESGGYYTLRSGSGFAFVRCPAFRHRPSQSDLLHVDVWWRGINVAIDAGTFSYNAPPPWDDPFAHAASHNTVIVNGADPMKRVSRFLWLPWPRGTVHGRWHSKHGNLSYWEGGHNGYERTRSCTRHRRGVLRIGSDWWLVLDQLQSRNEARCRLHWLLVDTPFSWERERQALTLHTSAGPYTVLVGALPSGAQSSLEYGPAESVRGWQARHYGSRSPAISLEMCLNSRQALFWTLLGPALRSAVMHEGSLALENGDWLAVVRLTTRDVESRPLIDRVTSSGTFQDVLEVR